MSSGGKVEILCECGVRRAFERTDRKRMEICSACGAVLRIPAFEHPGAGEAQIVAGPEEQAPAVQPMVAGRTKTRPGTSTPAKTTSAKPGAHPKPSEKQKKPPPRRTCPDCAYDVPRGASVCPNCKLDLDTRLRVPRRKREWWDDVRFLSMTTGHILGAFAIVYFLVAIFGPKVGLEVNWVTALLYAAVPFVAVGALFWARYFAVILGAAVGILIVLLLAGVTARIAGTGSVTSIHIVLMPALKILAAAGAGFYAVQIADERCLINGLGAGVLWAFTVHPVAGLILEERIRGFPLTQFAPVGAAALFYGLVFAAVGALVYSRFSET